MQKIIIPPATIGIMGGGQLARMFAMSARTYGYQVVILEPDPDCPAKHFANHHIISAYDDIAGLQQLINLSSVVTTEFENVPAIALSFLEKKIAVYPNHKAIAICQDRIAEKIFFQAHEIPTPQFYSIYNLADTLKIPTHFFKAILKTNRLGYDGKGQSIISNSTELGDAFNNFSKAPCILEQQIDLKYEFGFTIAKNQNEIRCYPIVRNIHQNGILHISATFNDCDETIPNTLKKYAIKIIKALDYTGILTIEFFVDKNNNIYANEMAPRPHNSAHYTLDACYTSQFEQQLRAICNIKLGNPKLFTHAIMLNLLGDYWHNADLLKELTTILAIYDNIKLHLYDKKMVKLKRKMGHLTILGQNKTFLLQQLNEILTILNLPKIEL